MLKDKFNKILVIILIVLVVIITLLAFLTSFQKPHVRNVEIVGDQNAADIVDQKMLISFSRPISRANIQDFIEVIPFANYSLNFIKNDLRILFNDNLDSNTEYTLKISRDLKDAYNESLSGDYEYKFKTNLQKFTYLSNGESQDTNKIIESDVNLSFENTLFEATKIKNYAVSKNYLAVITVNEDKTQSLVLINRRDGSKKDFGFEKTNIIAVDISKTEENLLYISQAVEPKESFLVPQDRAKINLYNINSQENKYYNPQNTAIDISFAGFSPDGANIIYKSQDAFYYLGDLDENKNVIGIGRFQTLGGFNKDVNKIIFTEFDPLATYSSFPFISIFNSNREIESITKGEKYIFDPKFFNKSDNIIFSEQAKELMGTTGLFRVVEYSKGEIKEVLTEEFYSLEMPQLSPDDSFLLAERYSQLDLLDYQNQRDFFNFRKPLYGDIVLFDFKTKEIIKTIEDAIEARWTP